MKLPPEIKVTVTSDASSLSDIADRIESAFDRLTLEMRQPTFTLETTEDEWEWGREDWFCLGFLIGVFSLGVLLGILMVAS